MYVISLICRGIILFRANLIYNMLRNRVELFFQKKKPCAYPCSKHIFVCLNVITTLIILRVVKLSTYPVDSITKKYACLNSKKVSFLVILAGFQGK